MAGRKSAMYDDDDFYDEEEDYWEEEDDPYDAPVAAKQPAKNAKPGPTSAKGASVLAQTLAAPPLEPKRVTLEQGGTFSLCNSLFPALGNRVETWFFFYVVLSAPLFP